MKTPRGFLVLASLVILGVSVVYQKPGKGPLRDALKERPALEQLQSVAGQEMETLEIPTPQGTQAVLSENPEPLSDFERGIRTYRGLHNVFITAYSKALEEAKSDQKPLLASFSKGGVSVEQARIAVETGLQGSEYTCTRYASAACMTLVTGKRITAQKLKELSVAPLVQDGTLNVGQDVQSLKQGAVRIKHLRELNERLVAADELEEEIRVYKQQVLEFKKRLLEDANKQGMAPPQMLRRIGAEVVSLDEGRTWTALLAAYNYEKSRSRLSWLIGQHDPKFIWETIQSSKALRALIMREVLQGRPVITQLIVAEADAHLILVLGAGHDGVIPEDKIYYYDSNVGYAAMPLRNFYPTHAFVIN